MTFNLYPTTSFIVILFNFLAWFFNGHPLFSFWHFLWILPLEQLLNALAQDLQMRIFKKWDK